MWALHKFAEQSCRCHGKLGISYVVQYQPCSFSFYCCEQKSKQIHGDYNQWNRWLQTAASCMTYDQSGGVSFVWCKGAIIWFVWVNVCGLCMLMRSESISYIHESLWNVVWCQINVSQQSWMWLEIWLKMDQGDLLHELLGEGYREHTSLCGNRIFDLHERRISEATAPLLQGHNVR